MVFNIVFIDLEKVYDRILREVMWWVLENKRVPLKYIKLIKDVYDGTVTSVRTSGGITSEFLCHYRFVSSISIKSI